MMQTLAQGCVVTITTQLCLQQARPPMQQDCSRPVPTTPTNWLEHCCCCCLVLQGGLTLMLVGAAAAGARALLGSAMRCALLLHLQDTLPAHSQTSQSILDHSQPATSQPE